MSKVVCWICLVLVLGFFGMLVSSMIVNHAWALFATLLLGFYGNEAIDALTRRLQWFESHK